MERELQRLTWKHIRDLVPDKIDTVLLPIGTIEAHGAAALDTDNFIPDSICEYLGDKVDALIAPTLNYGITKSLYGYPGSMTIKPENFENFVSDILRSLHDIGFKKVFIINGHGGNNGSLKTAAMNFYYKYKVNIAVIHWWELTRDLVKDHFGEAGGHAAIDENAMVQAVDDALVDKNIFDDNMPYYYRPGGDIYPIPGSILLYTENEGIPNFDLEMAQSYQKKVFAKVEEFVKMISDRWDKI